LGEDDRALIHIDQRYYWASDLAAEFEMPAAQAARANTAVRSD
jgi:hypothetical protein